MEGYQGWGFDARGRKTWNIFPDYVQSQLKERIYLPKPFLDEVVSSGKAHELNDLGVEPHSGDFPKDTFIISNHADELTVWTPLMAALANPKSPLPFLAIPCCSHSLSGARYRYPQPKEKKISSGPSSSSPEQVEQNPQPATGDLKALRAAKQDAHTDAGMFKSMYGCLTVKTMAVAEDVGYEVEKTLIRIPSTRNMGVLGGRRQVAREWSLRFNGRQPGDEDAISSQMAAAIGDTDRGNDTHIVGKVSEIVKRECSREGGVEAAAKIWIERARALNKGPGPGNQRGH
jgi:tRNASer (uridine44-2'-O)-methyltransferase